MQDTRSPPTDIDGKVFRLQVARYVAFALSVVFTALFVISATDERRIWMWLIITVGATGVQYVFTEIESSLFSGKLPAPWNKDATTATNWVYTFATAVLLFDMLLQLGGVGTFIGYVEKSMTGDILSNDFRLSVDTIRYIKLFMIALLSLLSATGSEIFGMYITYIQRQAADEGLTSTSKSATMDMLASTQSQRTIDNPLLFNSQRKGNKKP